MAINDTTQLAVKGVASGQDHVHTLHFRHLGPGSDGQTLIDEWQAACLTTYRAMHTVNYEAVQIITARHVCGTVPLRAAVEEVQGAGTRLGTRSVSTQDLPPWLAAVVSVRTAFSGPSRRGRFYIGGLVEGDQNAAVLDAALKTIITAYCTALTGAFGPAGTSGQFRLVVHSHKLASAPGTDCEDSSTLVTGFLVRDALGSMKSRKAGSGT